MRDVPHFIRLRLSQVMVLALLVTIFQGNISSAFAAEPISTIDVLVTYNDEAVSPFANDKAFRDWVTQAFDCNPTAVPACEKLGDTVVSVNGIMQGSGVNARFRIAGFQKISLNNLGSTNPIFTIVTNELVENARINAKADIVLFLGKYVDGVSRDRASTSTYNHVPSPETLVQTLSRSDLKTQPFFHLSADISAHVAVLLHPSNPGYRIPVIAHEFAHILGAGHESSDTAIVRLEPWSNAFTWTDNFGAGNLRTLEGKSTEGSSFILFFSSPKITLSQFGGVTIGNAKADNVQTMNKMAPMVSSYSERGSLDFTNRRNCRDVNGDGVVAPGDGLAIINLINSGRNAAIANLKDPRAVFAQYKFADVNGDKFITANDFLRIVNYINNPTNPAYSVCPN